MTTLSNKHYNGHWKVTEVKDDQRTPGGGSWERNVDSRFQVQLEKDGDDSTWQSWMKTSDLRPMFHWERQGISQVSQLSRERFFTSQGTLTIHRYVNKTMGRFQLQMSSWISYAMFFRTRKGSLMATTCVLVVLVVVTRYRFRKMPKALLIRNGKLRNLAYTFVTSFPTDLPS